MQTLEDLTIDISQSIEINAAVGDTYSALIRRLTSENSTPDNKPMPMVLEEWPGGAHGFALIAALYGCLG